jgi:ParB family chromosome partitioning protein
MTREKTKLAPKIELISVDRINILNPRIRNQKIFFGIAVNITKVGLKRPVTVTRCKSGVEGKDYDLVCGQGRLEAFMACGQKEIPAIIIDASEEQALIMSLVENLARRHHRAPDLLQGVEILRKQGYDSVTIAIKTGMSEDYIQGILNLMDKGEERLIIAVEEGYMPLTLAIQIAEEPEEEQAALQEAYNSKLLRGSRLLKAKRLLAMRRRQGKVMGIHGGRSGKSSEKKVSGKAILKIYQREVDRKRIMSRRATATSRHLSTITTALKDLLKEDEFRVLLREEKLVTLPKTLSSIFDEKGEIYHG